jgi:hypothetical protein
MHEGGLAHAGDRLFVYFVPLPARDSLMTWPPACGTDLLWICSSPVNNLSQKLPSVISKSFHLQNGPTKRDSVLELSDDFIFWEL